jgi:hypothetical protein
MKIGDKLDAHGAYATVTRRQESLAGPKAKPENSVPASETDSSFLLDQGLIAPFFGHRKIRHLLPGKIVEAASVSASIVQHLANLKYRACVVMG